MSANLYSGCSVTSFQEHLVDYKGGASLKQKDFTQKGIRVIPKKAVKKFGEFSLNPPIFTSEEFANTKKNSFVTDDYLITPLRDLVPSGPHLGLISENGVRGKSLLAQGVYGFRLKPTIHPKYAVYLSNANIFRKEIYRIMVGSTQVHVRAKEYFAIPFPLPPLPVQQKIATILDTADALKQKDKDLIAKYDELAQSLFLDMFGDPATNPKKWDVKDIGDVTFIDAPMVDPKKDQYLDLLHIGPDRIEKVTGKLLPAKTAREDRLVSNKFLFDKKYVLYSKIRPYLRKVALPDFSGLCSADMYPVRPDEQYLTREYLWNVLVSPAFTRYTDSLPRRANIPKINRKEFARYGCMLPPITLQNQFVERIQAIEQQKQQAEASLERSEDLFNCLLQKAFKGELVS